MRKYFIFLTVLCLLLTLFCCPCVLAEEKKPVVKLTEVVHSIFYAPQYVALNKEFFHKEGIEIELTTAWGGDKAAATLMSGSCDIALIGPEPSIYVYKQGASNYIINFAQLTNTAGSFLLARNPMPDFSWDDVKKKTIIGNRPGGAPQMVLEYVLKSRNMFPGKDVNVITNLDFTANAGAFVSGTGDFVQLFEPAASKLEKEDQGYVVASFGTAGGNVPYTVYMSRKKYINTHPQLIQSFTNAIYQAQIWVKNHSATEIASEIENYFPDTKEDILIKVVKRYKEQGTWDVNPIIERDIFNHYQDIIILAGELDKRVDYNILVNTKFAGNAVSE